MVVAGSSHVFEVDRHWNTVHGVFFFFLLCQLSLLLCKVDAALKHKQCLSAVLAHRSAIINAQLLAEYF